MNLNYNNTNKNMSLCDKILSEYGPPCKDNKEVSAAFDAFNDVSPDKQTIEILADLIVDEFRKEEGITYDKSSTYSVALDFSSSLLTDEEESYVSTRGGIWGSESDFLNKLMDFYRSSIQSNENMPSEEEEEKFLKEHKHSLRKIFNHFK